MTIQVQINILIPNRGPIVGFELDFAKFNAYAFDFMSSVGVKFL